MQDRQGKAAPSPVARLHAKSSALLIELLMLDLGIIQKRKVHKLQVALLDEETGDSLCIAATAAAEKLADQSCAIVFLHQRFLGTDAPSLSRG